MAIATVTIRPKGLPGDIGDGETRNVRVRLALVGCAALCVGASPVAPGNGADASAMVASADSQKRYTLTMTYTADAQQRYFSESCGWGSPVPPASDLIWVCNLDDVDSQDLRSYAASSVRPFTLTRSGSLYSFTARMKGASQEGGSRSEWSSWWLGGEGQSDSTSTGASSATGPLTGEVSLNGTNPARLKIDMSATNQQGTQTVVYCSERGCTTTTEQYPGGFIDDAWLKRVNLRKVFGEEFTVVDRRTTPPLTTSGWTTHEKWRFRFTPVAEPPKTERWQIEVRGQDRWSWGMYTGLSGGVDVDWAHRTTLVVKDGKLISAKGKVHIIKVRPFSEPPGAFDISYKTITPPSYELTKAVKRGDRVELGLWKDNRSNYRVNFSIRAAGPELLDRLRTIGVANPEATYQTVLARGTIQDSAAPMVPSSPRLVVRLRPGVFNRDTDEFNKQLPCLDSGAQEQDCFLTRGGQRVTVTELK